MDPSIEVLNVAGIDSSLGLKNVGGKRERYESLLRKFAEKQARTVETIRDALSADDGSAAQREAHSLRGAASTLGVTELATHAGNVENAIRTNGDVDRALEILSHSLIAVVQAIRTAFPV